MSADPLQDVTIGVELELMAPRGCSRREVATAIASKLDGRIVQVFHPDSEPSLVPGTPVFENLTLGFEVVREDGTRIARVVDDLTLQADLDRGAAPVPGWFRIVSDDRRILHLVRRHGRADRGPREALEPVARLFGTEVTEQDGILGVADPDGSPVAMGAPLPGERERPCELVTAPIPRTQLYDALSALLDAVGDLGLSIANEAATHIHVDRRPFEDARVVRELVRTWEAQRGPICVAVGTNPRCSRLGHWTPALRELVEEPGFSDLSWPAAKARLGALGLSKFVDVNLKGLAHDIPGKPTIEARFFPGAGDAATVVEMAEKWLGFLDGVRGRALG